MSIWHRIAWLEGLFSFVIFPNFGGFSPMNQCRSVKWSRWFLCAPVQFARSFSVVFCWTDGLAQFHLGGWNAAGAIWRTCFLSFGWWLIELMWYLWWVGCGCVPNEPVVASDSSECYVLNSFLQLAFDISAVHAGPAWVIIVLTYILYMFSVARSGIELRRLIRTIAVLESI